MVLLLTIGDLHIPLRTHDLPLKFKKLLVPGKIGQIVCTGNVCDRETWEYLRGVAPDVRGVRGDFDETQGLPPSLVIQHGPLRIGVIHGHQIVPVGDTEALAAAARKLDVDVLVSGATHRFEAFEFESRFFINPGSATGAFTPSWPISPPDPTAPAPAPPASSAAPSSAAASPNPDAPSTTDTDAKANGDAPDVPDSPPGPTPSFALLDIQGPVVVTYVYRLVGGEVKVEKFEYRKEVATTGPREP